MRSFAMEEVAMDMAVSAPQAAKAESDGGSDDFSGTNNQVAGVDEGEAAHTFCNTGHYGSVVWFVGSELLGRDDRLYDGSMFDWTFVRGGKTVIGAPANCF